MKYFEIVKLDKYQHYKDRNMVWFKWHIDCLQDFKFMSLKPKERWDFIGLICLACKCNNKISYDKSYLERTLNTIEIDKTIATLLASKMLAKCYQNAIPIREEKRREEIVATPPNTNSSLKEDSSYKEVLDYFFSEVKKEFGFNPEISGKKDGANLKRILGKYSPTQLKELIDWYLNNDKLNKKLGISLSVILSANVINDWLKDTI